MNDILNKLGSYVGQEIIVDEDEILERALNFIMSLEPDMLSEEQADEVMSIIESFDDDEEEDEELIDGEIYEFAKKKVRIDPAARRKRKAEYRKTKAKRKLMTKKYRRSAKGKMMAKKAKRMKKTGKTATEKEYEN